MTEYDGKKIENDVSDEMPKWERRDPSCAIFNVSITSFSLAERIRILFGKKHHLKVDINVDKPVQVISTFIVYEFVEPFFKPKEKGLVFMSPNQNKKV